jgi:hypothetical protein
MLVDLAYVRVTSAAASVPSPAPALCLSVPAVRPEREAGSGPAALPAPCASPGAGIDRGREVFSGTGAGLRGSRPSAY